MSPLVLLMVGLLVGGSLQCDCDEEKLKQIAGVVNKELFSDSISDVIDQACEIKD